MTDTPFKERGSAPHVALVVVQIFFGTWPIVGKIALRSISSASLVSFRITGGALIFFLLRRSFGQLRDVPKRVLAWIVLSALLGVVVNQLLFVKGLSYTTVINATLLTTTIPVFTLVISIALGHDRASLRNVLGIALAAAGVIYLVDPFRATISAATTRGNLLLVANSFSYGAYIAVSRNLVKRYGAFNVISWLFAVSAIIILPVAAFAWTKDNLAAVPASAWIAIIYIVLVPTVFVYYLNAWALTKVAPSIVAVYIYLQPLVAFGLAPAILGERLNSRTLLSCILIFAGVAVVTIKSRSRAVEDVSEEPTALAH
ncbi:MAG TPA: DMT family transporter [Pyrinomonadaceae bacterium]|nr:DMT family transporter [Pyrinomonadaceae bacterium]